MRRGEKGTPVVWFQMIDRKDRDDTDEDEKAGKIPCARVGFVFNVAQVDGAQVQAAPARRSAVEAVAAADALVKNSGAMLVTGGTQAFYRPSTDTVHMPAVESFTGTSTSSATEAYYGTLLHELTHWTGPRLHRDFSGRFGTAAYAAEELVAELGSAIPRGHAADGSPSSCARTQRPRLTGYSLTVSSTSPKSSPACALPTASKCALINPPRPTRLPSDQSGPYTRFRGVSLGDYVIAKNPFHGRHRRSPTHCRGNPPRPTDRGRARRF